MWRILQRTKADSFEDEGVQRRDWLNRDQPEVRLYSSVPIVITPSGLVSVPEMGKLMPSSEKTARPSEIVQPVPESVLRLSLNDRG